MIATTEEERLRGMARRREIMKARGIRQWHKDHGWSPPSDEMINRIKTGLGLRQDDPLPRCRSKSYMRVRYLAKHGDPSHLVPAHICEECQCKKTAGWGTIGEYGYGELVGHYGWGLCIVHECALTNAPFSEAIQRVHKTALRQGMDFAYESSGNQWLARVQREAEMAKERVSLFAEVDILRGTMQELHDKCMIGAELPACKAIEDAMKVGESLKDCGADPEQINILQAKIDAAIDMLKPFSHMTERAKNGAIDMTDATRITLATKLAAVIGQLSVAQSRVTSKDYIHVDNIKIWIRAIYQLTREMFHPAPEVESKWLNAMSQIPEPPRGIKI